MLLPEVRFFQLSRLKLVAVRRSDFRVVLFSMSLVVGRFANLLLVTFLVPYDDIL